MEKANAIHRVRRLEQVPNQVEANEKDFDEFLTGALPPRLHKKIDANESEAKQTGIQLANVTTKDSNSSPSSEVLTSDRGNPCNSDEQAQASSVMSGLETEKGDVSEDNDSQIDIKFEVKVPLSVVSDHAATRTVEKQSQSKTMDTCGKKTRGGPSPRSALLRRCVSDLVKHTPSRNGGRLSCWVVR